MSEENKAINIEENNADNPSTDASKNNDAIPYSRFQEVNSERNNLKNQIATMQEKLDTIDAENKTKREERLKKNEEYTTLLAEKDADITKYKSTADKWNTYEATRRDSLTSRLPENKQKFASSMQLQDLEEFVELETANINKGTGTDSSRAGVQPAQAGEFGGYSSYAEWAAKDPKGYEQANTVAQLGGVMGWTNDE